MHDNARPHTARLTQNYLARHNVNVLQWPACSPDMNPIEHFWDILGRRARENYVINNINDLRAALIQEWNAIPNDIVRRYGIERDAHLLKNPEEQKHFKVNINSCEFEF